MMVKFSDANAKLKALYDVAELERWLQDRRKVYSFDLISGWSCPQAKDCLSKVHVINTDGKKKLIDGKDCKFRCFSASQEATFPNVYKKRKHNFRQIKGISYINLGQNWPKIQLKIAISDQK